jgi:hypothetical protein
MMTSAVSVPRQFPFAVPLPCGRLTQGTVITLMASCVRPIVLF